MPIRRVTVVSDADQAVADFAYNLWLSSAFRGGSPEKALLTAMQLTGTAPAALFLVPKRTGRLQQLSDLKERQQ